MKKRILIIDDNQDILELTEFLLNEKGYEVVASSTPHILSELSQINPDLILLDIIMPVMDGITMIKKLREANEWGKTVPVIFLTNLGADDDNIMKAITDDEPAYYLVKSDHTINDILEKVKERLFRV